VASRGIRVNAVAPGFIATAMTDQLTDEQRQGILHTVPAGSLGEPQDVANAVRFLCSDASRYITGEVLRVDGGMAM